MYELQKQLYLIVGFMFFFVLFFHVIGMCVYTFVLSGDSVSPILLLRSSGRDDVVQTNCTPLNDSFQNGLSQMTNNFKRDEKPTFSMACIFLSGNEGVNKLA
jgi:hypothetical protein